MSLIVPNEGRTVLLGNALGNSGVAIGDFYVALYVDDINISSSLTWTMSTFTGHLETVAAAVDYKAVTGAGWTTTAGVGTHSGVTFTYTGGSPADSYNIYGYVVTNNAKTKCLWAERFGTLLTLPSGQGTITLTLKINLTQPSDP